jgi:hypothetical protein
VVLGIEHRTLCLIGRCSPTWVISPSLLTIFCFLCRIPLTLPRLASNFQTCDLPVSASKLTGIIGEHYHTCLQFSVFIGYSSECYFPFYCVTKQKSLIDTWLILCLLFPHYSSFSMEWFCLKKKVKQINLQHLCSELSKNLNSWLNEV